MNKLHFGVIDTGFGSARSYLAFGLAKESGFLSKNRDDDDQHDPEKNDAPSDEDGYEFISHEFFDQMIALLDIFPLGITGIPSARRALVSSYV